MTHDEMIKALADVRDQLVRQQVPAEHRQAPKRKAKIRPMFVMRRVVKDWEAGAKENHEALQHRGTDCCDTFTVEEIMRMIDDAERELGWEGKA